MTEQAALNDTTPCLGMTVAYTDSRSCTKPAIVLGGPADDERLPDLADQELNLVIFSGTGSHVVRPAVPRDDDGKPRTWRPIL